MRKELRDFMVGTILLVIIVGGVGFLLGWFSGRKGTGIGILAGAGIGLIELVSTYLIFQRVRLSRSKAVWGVLLAVKSLLIFSVIGMMILWLKISGFGFIIGFSGAVLSIMLMAVFLKPEPEGKRDEGISHDI